MVQGGNDFDRSGRQPLVRWSVGGAAVAVAALVALVYLALPSRDFNGDGLGYAYQVESASATQLWSIAGRLLYCPVGRLLHSALALIGVEVRSIYVLQAMNSLFGALAAGLFFTIAYRVSKSLQLALVASLGLAFSGGNWFWSVNVTSYPGYVLFLVASLYLLLRISDVRITRSYLLLAALVGLAHSLTCCFWLTGIILAPAVVLLVIIIPRSFRTTERLAGGAIYVSAFALFFLVPMIVAGVATADVSTASEFSSWLAAGAHGTRPELTAANFMRGTIGFSSSLFHIVSFGPWVKERLLNVPFVVADRDRLIFEAIAFGLIWLIVAGLIFSLVRLRRELVAAHGRTPALLLLWSVIPIIWGLTWGGADTQRWLVVLPAFWLLATMVVGRIVACATPTLRRIAVLVLPAFVSVMAMYNLVFAIYPATDLERNPHYCTAGELSPHLEKADLVLLWGNDHAFTGADLWYFFGKSSMDLTLEGNKFWDTFESHLSARIAQARERDGRVFVSDRVFLEHDRPESRYSAQEQRVQRREVGQMLSKWPRRAAFTQGGDTFYQLIFDDSTGLAGE